MCIHIEKYRDVQGYVRVYINRHICTHTYIYIYTGIYGDCEDLGGFLIKGYLCSLEASPGVSPCWGFTGP